MNLPTTPETTKRQALRVACVTGPLTVVMLTAWAFKLLPERPTLVFMVYQLLLLLTLAAGMVAAIAAGQQAIGRAFTVGYLTGMQAAAEDDSGPKHRRGLRAVD